MNICLKGANDFLAKGLTGVMLKPAITLFSQFFLPMKHFPNGIVCFHWSFVIPWQDLVGLLGICWWTEENM